jgi:hypothetical protein
MWGKGYDWPRVRELLEQLLEEGILRRADADESEFLSPHGAWPSPLPPAHSTVPRTWFECEAITRELTGHPLELGYLELVIPIFRVAHVAMDAEGRQVGEANVFPKPPRLDVPTEWRTCPHAGSRYQDDRPMNVTALKSMGKHWTQMMVALLRIREAYLHRFPKARHGWTVGDLERLSTLVLTVPAYLLMREPYRVENGHLHPVLSSMFRVTDGVRMTMHQMLFVPLYEPTLPPDAPMTSAEIYAYAERNYRFPLGPWRLCRTRGDDREILERSHGRTARRGRRVGGTRRACPRGTGRSQSGLRLWPVRPPGTCRCVLTLACDKPDLRAALNPCRSVVGG